MNSYWKTTNYWIPSWARLIITCWLHSLPIYEITGYVNKVKNANQQLGSFLFLATWHASSSRKNNNNIVSTFIWIPSSGPKSFLELKIMPTAYVCVCLCFMSVCVRRGCLIMFNLNSILYSYHTRLQLEVFFLRWHSTNWMIIDKTYWNGFWHFWPMTKLLTILFRQCDLRNKLKFKYQKIQTLRHSQRHHEIIFTINIHHDLYWRHSHSLFLCLCLSHRLFLFRLCILVADSINLLVKPKISFHTL